MRVEMISSINKTLNVKPANIKEDQVVQDKSILEKGERNQDVPKNFETMDPNKYEPISIGELELIKAIEKANKTLKGANTNFQFSIHEATRAIMVKIINSETQEVIRELPPEKILDMVAKMWEMAGIFVDRKI